MKAKYDASFSRLLGYDKIVPRNQEGLEMLRAAVAAFDSVLRPADERSVLKALARLKISTAYRNQYEDDAEFERRVYVVELCQFPLDVVLEACQRWARREKWFPTISEIRDECQWLVRYRRVTRDALANALPDHGQEQASA